MDRQQARVSYRWHCEVLEHRLPPDINTFNEGERKEAHPLLYLGLNEPNLTNLTCGCLHARTVCAYLQGFA